MCNVTILGQNKIKGYVTMKNSIEISTTNPIIRLPKDFIKNAEPDKRKKKVKLSFSLSDDCSTIVIAKINS